MLGLVLGSPKQGRDGLTEASPKKATKMIKGVSCVQGEAEKAGTIQLGKEKARGRSSPYLIGGNEEEGAKLFSLVPTDRTRNKWAQNRNTKLHQNT